MKSKCILALLAVCLAACNFSNNGRYVVYNVVREPYGNDSISNYLVSSLQGNYYDIKYHDKFVTVHSVKNNQDMMLARDNESESSGYSLDYERQSAKFHVQLMKQDELSITISLSLPNDKMIVMPAQLGGYIGPNRKSASVKCLLSKAD